MTDAGRTIARSGLSIAVAAADGDPDAIETAMYEARAGLNIVDDLIVAAWCGPSRELFAAASTEYRENRPAVVSPRASPSKAPTRRAEAMTLTPRAVAERERLRAAWPKQWKAGVAAEMARRGPGQELTTWPPDARAAFFAGAATVVEHRRGAP